MRPEIKIILSQKPLFWSRFFRDMILKRHFRSWIKIPDEPDATRICDATRQIFRNGTQITLLVLVFSVVRVSGAHAVAFSIGLRQSGQA